MKLFLDQHKVYLQDGNLCKCESIEKFITLVRFGMFLLNFNTHEFIPNFLMRYYDDFPNSYIVNTVFINSGTIEYQKEQIQALRKLGFEMGN